MTRPSRRPRILLLAPDFACATGQTPALLARHGRRFDHRLFPVRSTLYRGRSLRRLAGAADVIHWHANPAHFPLAVEAVAAGGGHARTVVTVHHVAEGDDYVVDAAVAVADVLHVPCDDTAAALAGRPVQVRTVPYLLEPRPVRPATRPEGFGWVVGWCGQCTSLHDRKRLDTLIGALAELADHRPTLRLQGWVPDEVAAAAEAAGVTTEVVPPRPWAGRGHFYETIDVYCSPSEVEGGPLTVFEAAAHGVPVVTSPVGMAARLVDAGGAWPAVPGDPGGLARVLLAVASSADDRRRRRDRAFAVVDDLAAPRGVDEYEALYAELLGIRPPEPSGAPPLAARLELARPRLDPVVGPVRRVRMRLTGASDTA